MIGPALNLPRLVFGSGAIATLSSELAAIGVSRALLISDRGLEAAGLVEIILGNLPHGTPAFLDVPENPTADGANTALAAYRSGGCDGIVALGGGSVLDTAKLVAALAATSFEDALEIIGHPDRIASIIPLVAIPTTVGTGSESSPVAALHRESGGPAIGTRHPLLVPRIAMCDSDMVRTLPKRLLAATAIDALSHCIEGFFAEPANPIIDALALDGIARVCRDVHTALEPEGENARRSLMAAAFAGGAAIHKGLGPAHAVALACADQDLHHGTIIGVALATTTQLLAAHLPAKGALVREAMGLSEGADLKGALQALISSLSLPTTLSAAGYEMRSREALVAGMIASPFNRTSPYPPTREDYNAILDALA